MQHVAWSVHTNRIAHTVPRRVSAMFFSGPKTVLLPSLNV